MAAYGTDGLSFLQARPYDLESTPDKKAMIIRSRDISPPRSVVNIAVRRTEGATPSV